MIRKLTRRERFLTWLLNRIDDRLALVSEREYERHQATTASRVIAYVEASRRN